MEGSILYKYRTVRRIQRFKMATRELVLSCKSKAKILKWHVKPGESVKKDKLLATYIFTEKVDQSNLILQRKLKSKFDGKVLELTVNPNDEVKKG